MLKIALITESTYTESVTRQVADWLQIEMSKKRQDTIFEVVDIWDYHLTVPAGPLSDRSQKAQNEQIAKWSDKINTFDALIFVSPEYYHSSFATIKYALNMMCQEWNDNLIGMVMYGGCRGGRVIVHLKPVLYRLKSGDKQTDETTPLFIDFDNYSSYIPDPRHKDEIDPMLDQLTDWGKALRQIRTDISANKVIKGDYSIS